MISGDAQIYKDTNRCGKCKVILGPPGHASYTPAVKKKPWHNCHMSSHLLSTSKWCTRLILQSAMKMEQAPAESYTKHMKHTQAKSHDLKRLLSDKRESTEEWQSSHGAKKMALFGISYITSILQRLSFKPEYVLQVGLTSPWNLCLFSSFSVTVDKNVNKLLCLESSCDISCATDLHVKIPWV